MPFEDLSKDELIRILELIDKSQRVSGSRDLQKLINKSAELLEAEYALCGLVRPGTDSLPAVTSYVNGSYPEQWVRRYLERGYLLKDPVVRFHMNYAFTQTWADVIKRFDDEDARHVVDEASEHGLRYGITGALYVPEVNNIALFIFAGRADNFGAHQKRIADILSMHLTQALVDCSVEALDAGQRFGDKGYQTQREGKAW